MTRERAIEAFESGWWKGLAAREIVAFQLFEERLCMPFSEFHKAVGDALGRPVFAHEFGLNVDGLRSEFLKLRPPATFEEILSLIPEDKCIVIKVKE